MSHDVQILIAGGGPAGAAAALVLARRGRRVLLAEGAAPDPFRIGEAVPPAARPLLRDLGVLDRFLADGHLPCYGNVSVWGNEQPSTTDFIFDPNGHGWHVDRTRFDATLRHAARDAGAQLLPGTRAAEVARDSDAWRVTLTDGAGCTEERRCDWLIDATGSRASLARRAGATRLRDDTLIAVYARFRAMTDTDRDSRTVVESGPDGWWYTALIPSGERVVAFLTDADLIDRSSVRSTDGFVKLLRESRYIRGLLTTHQYEMISLSHSIGAQTGWLDPVAGAGWTAVGDAAISFDPLSSQGILTALFTGLRAGLAVDRALTGDSGGIEEYRHRVAEIHETYRRRRNAYYSAERRWPDRPFWRRRMTAS